MIEGLTGTIGSGKSVLLNLRMLDMAVKGRDLALNFEVNEQGLYLALRKRGMGHREAMDKINRIIVIRTYEQLRGLKNRWLALDEGHFWFFSRMWERISLQDVQFWSLSRKLGVDVTIVTQRWNAIDSTVRELAQNIWNARPLVSREVRLQPFGAALSAWNASGVGSKWLGMFLYTKMQDTMGSTKDQRKGLMGSVNAKSICVLTAHEARVYDTGRFFTSPLIEEDVRRQRVEYLKNVYTGQLTPLQTCVLCGGLGRQRFTFSLEDIVEGLWRPAESRVAAYDDSYASFSDCPVCGGSGYFSDPSHADIEEAMKAALTGLLGPDCKRDAERRTAGQDIVPASSIKRGGGGRFGAGPAR